MVDTLVFYSTLISPFVCKQNPTFVWQVILFHLAMCLTGQVMANCSSRQFLLRNKHVTSLYALIFEKESIGGFPGKTSKGKKGCVWGGIVILLLNIVIAVGAWNWDNNLAAIKGTNQGKDN